MGTQLLPEKGAQPLTQFLAHVYCGQTPGWINMPLGTEVTLGPGDVVLDWVTSFPKRGTAPQFSAHVYCGQMAAWMKMPVSTEVDLDPGHIVLDGELASPAKAAQRPSP